ncbi:MAG: hypothetical protein NVSMB64_10430 [Candidatus Velthaea sp.]
MRGVPPGPTTGSTQRMAANASMPTPHAGVLDSTFGNHGKVTTFINPNSVNAVALQPDGKIVVAASLQDGRIATQSLGVVRYLQSGALDASFGTGGVVRTIFTTAINTPAAVVIAADGRIVVAGNASDATGTSFAIARFQSNGALDASFGNNGTVLTRFTAFENAAATAAIAQADGNIVVTGSATTGDGDERPPQVAIVRYISNGKLDAAFGTRGVTLVPGSAPGALALQADGSYLVASESDAGSPAFVKRFAANGAPASLMLGHIVQRAHSGRIAFAPDTRVLLAAGAAEFGDRHDSDVIAERFAATGVRDAGFTTQPVDFSGAEGPNALQNSGQAIHVADGGRVTVGGNSQPSPLGGTIFGLVRYTAAGALDTQFGVGGIVATSFFGADSLTSLVVQADGKTIAAGITGNNPAGTTAIALARYSGP